MEEKNKETINISLKTATILIVVTIILVAIIVCGYTFWLINKKNNNKDIVNENKINSIQDSKVETLETEENVNNVVNKKEEITGNLANNVTSNEIKKDDNEVSKLDNSKDLVYDATYTYKDLNNKSYISTTMDKNYSLKDIVVPYINLNSEDATKANDEIKSIFNNLATFFEQELKEDTPIWYNISNYEYFINKNILSIVITVESGGTDVEKYQYYTFNFDLNTLKLINFEEMYKNAGFTSDSINLKSENEIKNSSHLKNLTDEDCGELETVDTYINNSVNNYKQSVSKNEIKYYLDKNGKFNIIVNIEAPVGTGNFETILTLN